MKAIFRLLSLTLLFFVAAQPAAAQCVAFAEVVSFDIAGVIGRIADWATPDEIVTHHTYCEQMHREETGDIVRITRLDARTLTEIDTKRKTFKIIHLDTLAAFWARHRQQMQSGSTNDPENNAEVDVKIDASVVGPVQHHGEPEHHDIHVVATYTAEATDNQTGQTETQSGQLAFVTETWREPLANYEVVDRFNRAFAEIMTDAALGEQGKQQLMETLNTILQNDERLQAGLERAAEEAARLEAEGPSVREITHIINVAEGTQYDPALVFAEADKKPEKKKKRGLRGLKDRVEQAAAGGSASSQPAGQRRLAKFERETKDYDSNAAAPSTDPPGGYKEIPFELGR